MHSHVDVYMHSVLMGQTKASCYKSGLAHIPPLPQPRAQILTMAWHEPHTHPSTSVSSPGSGVYPSELVSIRL